MARRSRGTRGGPRNASGASGRGKRGGSQQSADGEPKTKLKKVGGKRLPARSSSARDEKRGVTLVRLNKFLADNGVASRRGSDELIAAGKVMVDDDIATELGMKIDPSTQTVDVDGVRLKSDPRERRYYILHKPSGVVCTNEIRETRPRAIDLITDPRRGRIFTVGRLDEESKGLLLLTSDGEFAERIAHPRFGVAKTYLVKVSGRVEDDAVNKIREGVHLAEGRTAGARVLIKRRTTTSSTLEVSIQEGKNREVRRVFARVGYKVLSLTRTRIGPLGIRGIREGKWRALSRDEVEALLRESDGQGPTDRGEGSYHAGGAGDAREDWDPLEDRPVRPRRVRGGPRRSSGGGFRSSSSGGPRRGAGSGSRRGGGVRAGSRRSSRRSR